MTVDTSLPLHVLTGFLGSGKTTLLNRLLKSEDLAGSAVIVNEFGEVGIDHLLVEHSEDNLVELAGGCVCCTVRGDLAATVLELMARRRDGSCTWFDRIIVETTGLADPTPIGNLLVTDPALAEAVHLAGIITTVDCINGPATLDDHPNAVRQVALADHLLLTKTDVEGADPILVTERVTGINPWADISQVDHGQANLAAFLFRAPVAGNGDAAAAGTATFKPPPEAAEHSHHHHTDGVESFVLERHAPVPGAALALFIEMLAEHAGSDLLRVKGLVCLDEAPQCPALLQGAQHVFQELTFA